MKEWLVSNFVCRFIGHRGSIKMPLFVPWRTDPRFPAVRERGLVHCDRCDAVTGQY